MLGFSLENLHIKICLIICLCITHITMIYFNNCKGLYFEKITTLFLRFEMNPSNIKLLNCVQSRKEFKQKIRYVILSMRSTNVGYNVLIDFDA